MLNIPAQCVASADRDETSSHLINSADASARFHRMVDVQSRSDVYRLLVGLELTRRAVAQRVADLPNFNPRKELS
jgi:hypothetical protein